MKKTLIMLSLCALLVGCTKDWGTPTTRDYPINAIYSGLEVSNAFQVTVSDQVSDVVVTVGELAHEKVLVEVKNGKLHIGFKPNTMYNGVATAVIPATLLLDLDLSGASSFTGNLEGNSVDIDLSGASIFKGNVSAERADFDLSGASTFTGSLDVYKLSFDLSGSSTVTVEGNCHTYMEINLSGSSYADVTCCSSLEVGLSGGSTLVYGTVSDDCKPVVNNTTSGGSVVRQRY